MELPQNTNLPFFSYGIFKPGELAFHRIKDYVLSQKKIIVKGNLCDSVVAKMKITCFGGSSNVLRSALNAGSVSI